MASWKDGAAYAPTERPDGFATPRVEPLSAGEPWKAPTPGPLAPPASYDAAAQPPLAQVASGGKPSRDPRESFAVTTSALAPGPLPGAKRDPRQPILTTAPQPVGREWVSAEGSQLPPTGPPLPPPGELLDPAPAPHPPQPARPAVAAPLQAPSGGQVPARRVQAAPRPSAEPPPPHWPPPPPGLPQGPPAQVKQLAFIAGGLCFLGFVLPPTSPFVLTAAGALGMRTEALTGRAGRSALAIGLATLGWQLITDSLGTTSLVGMIASLVCAVVFLAGALRSR